jgi:TatD DNase family protein
MRLIDSHCHLEPNSFPLVSEVVERAKAQGVVHAIVIGQFQAPGDFGFALNAAQAHHDFLTPTMGIHPHDAQAAQPGDWQTLERLCGLPQVAAVGETGLDFFYNHSPKAVQLSAFHQQCQLAKALKKPIVIHVRDAHPECVEVLRSEGMHEGVIHCFTGDTEAARRYLDLGFFLSISGVVTYKKNEALQAAVAFAPIERLMVETDSPYLAPVPHRGRKNEPANVGYTALKVAELKGVDREVAALKCALNAKQLFRLSVDLT